MNTLPMHPGDAVQIGNSCFSVAWQDGKVVYFSNLQPFEWHEVDDRPSMMLRVARFAESGIRQADLQEVFGIGRATVQRAVKQFREQGAESFYLPSQRGVRSVFVGEVAEKADRLLAAGMSGAAVGRELGIAPATVNYNRRKGYIGAGKPTCEPPAEMPETLAEAQETPAAVP